MKSRGCEGNRWIETCAHTHIEVFVVAWPTFLWAQIWNCAPVHARVNLTPVSPHWEETESWAWAKASPLPLSAPAVLIRLAESLLLLQTGSRGSQGQVSVPLRQVWVSWREVDDCCCKAMNTLTRPCWRSWWLPSVLGDDWPWDINLITIKHWGEMPSLTLWHSTAYISSIITLYPDKLGKLKKTEAIGWLKKLRN